MIVAEAAAFAHKAHATQTRKRSLTPYIEHPRRVADAVTGLSYSTPEMVAAAWLHDVVEDTPITLAFIEARFGRKVAEYVGWLTNRFTKEAFPELNRAQRKHLEAVRLSYAPREVKVIKMFDRIDNLTDKPDKSLMAVYLDESMELYYALRDAHPEVAGLLRSLIEQLSAEAK